MKVFKFGGASVSTAERIEGLIPILRQFAGEKILVVISAMGKTTNALEEVVNAFFQGNTAEALALFAVIREQHTEMCRTLQSRAQLAPDDKTYARLADFYTEVEWLLHDKPVRDYAYYYDQVVCIGELLSTSIVSDYLNSRGLANAWIDVRDLLRTDDNFRDARIDWNFTDAKAHEELLPLFDSVDLVITQGFIGATDENESTTLGREGSDYTAAVFANLLDAESQTIWKDVPGVMNADPKLYAAARWISELNYQEVIEMAYYGAQVIHPKTIKPLQNKNIPLYVRSFLNPENEGTCIHHRAVHELPPIIVYKQKQVLMELKSRDFSFVGEGLTEEVYRIFAALKFRPNITQNAAISLLCVVDDLPEKVEALALQASAIFDVNVTRDLTILTIRHYRDDLLAELSASRRVLVKQQTADTVQVVMQ